MGIHKKSDSVEILLDSVRVCYQQCRIDKELFAKQSPYETIEMILNFFKKTDPVYLRSKQRAQLTLIKTEDIIDEPPDRIS